MALARALAVEPTVLLLDEPFGALDAKVRKELRDWLRRLHDEVHVTTVFVTHDQEEALEVADEIVVINEGRIEQIGTPDELYDQPANDFVMSFLGPVTRLGGHARSAARHRAARRAIPAAHTRDDHAGQPVGFEVRVDVAVGDAVGAGHLDPHPLQPPGALRGRHGVGATHEPVRPTVVTGWDPSLGESSAGCIRRSRKCRRPVGPFGTVVDSMWITRRTDYATRAVLALALAEPDELLSVEDIAQRGAMPMSVAKQVMNQMRSSGLVRSERGPDPRYRLNHPPDEISLERVVRLFQGQLAPIECATRHEPEECPMTPRCSLQAVCAEARVTRLLRFWCARASPTSRARRRGHGCERHRSRCGANPK